jgi:segregation and condensation protein B
MELKLILESLLFSAQKPLSVKELREVLDAASEHADGNEIVRALRKTKESELTAALEQLARDHEEAKRSYRLVCVAGAWQFVTQPEFAPWLKALVGVKARPPRLSQPALETLAIIAYRQPITRAEMEQVRGVSVDGVLQTLVERGIVEQVGVAEVIGRPRTFGTTVAWPHPTGSALTSSLGLEARHDEPPLRPPTVDKLLGRKARAGPQVRQVALGRARSNADASRRTGNGPARRNEGGEHIDLAGSRRP